MDEPLQSLVERYAAFVHASALRRTGDELLAEEITRAVFLVLARRARKLSRKTVLAEWLFGITKLATRKTQPSRLWPWRWFRRAKRQVISTDAPLWAKIAPRFDRELDRLSRRSRAAFLLLNVLRIEFP
jgi:DNA-directed RNA polymerase specialized sigma24 family protein